MRLLTIIANQLHSCNNRIWLNEKAATTNTFVWVNNDMIIGWCMRAHRHTLCTSILTHGHGSSSSTHRERKKWNQQRSPCTLTKTIENKTTNDQRLKKSSCNRPKVQRKDCNDDWGKQTFQPRIVQKALKPTLLTLITLEYSFPSCVFGRYKKYTFFQSVGCISFFSSSSFLSG